jgi:dienelactone hydrolase
MRRFRWVNTLCAGVLALAAIQVRAAAPSIPAVFEGSAFVMRSATDASGRAITYYMSRPKNGPAPLMLMIQGSGCNRIAYEQGGQKMLTLFNLLQLANEGRFAIVAVEKPFAVADGRSGGTAQGCSAQFNAEFSAGSWLAALQAAIKDARASPWVDPRRTLVFGASEGAVMASLLAGSDPRVTDVIAIGGSGTSQLFDFIAGAYRNCFNVAPCLEQVEQTARAIASDPASSVKFAWGHPYKRWSSFFQVDPGEQLLRSKARVYLAFGTADTAVPPLSQEIMAARLLSAGRDVTIRRVPDADHGLRQAGATTWDDLDKEQRAALDWFWRRAD